MFKLLLELEENIRQCFFFLQFDGSDLFLSSTDIAKYTDFYLPLYSEYVGRLALCSFANSAILLASSM